MVPVKVKSIHNNNYQQAEYLGHHDRGCLCVAPINKKEHKHLLTGRNMKWGTIATNKQDTKICYRFKAIVQIEDHSSTLVSGYTSTLYMGNIRQPGRLILDKNDNIKQIKSRSERSKITLKTGDVKEVMFKFINTPRYVERGTSLLFRCGKIHGYGIVSDYVPVEEDDDAKPDVEDRVMRRRHGIANHILKRD
jgi:GTPase